MKEDEKRLGLNGRDLIAINTANLVYCKELFTIANDMLDIPEGGVSSISDEDMETRENTLNNVLDKLHHAKDLYDLFEGKIEEAKSIDPAFNKDFAESSEMLETLGGQFFQLFDSFINDMDEAFERVSGKKSSDKKVDDMLKDLDIDLPGEDK